MRRFFRTMSCLMLMVAITVVNAFVVPTTTITRRVLSSLIALSSSLEDEEKRMEMVRQLQKTFYSSSSSSSTSSDDDNNDQEDPHPFLEPETGRMMNLPLWRVGWVEVPGRANCLNVHEGHYTNMFEKILNSSSCGGSKNNKSSWYFGHLHLPGGTKAARTGERRFELKSWYDEIQDANRFDEKERSAVVGTLMRISDFRRLQDGRLILLVHALERFVVDEVVQTFPHGVAHVQLLPDLEEMPAVGGGGMDENFGKTARAAAVEQSFRYHDYECDPIPLPLPKDTEYMSTQDVFGAEIAKCLPFCFYSRDDSSLKEIKPLKQEVSTESFAGGQPLLEERLQTDLVLRNPPPLPGAKSRASQDVDALETFLWLALEDFCRNSGFVLPEEVLCLMPPHMDYLDIMEPSHKQFFLSKDYPAIRRQRRLSYAIPALIENTNLGAPIPMRQIFLNTPSTQARLAAVLERIEMINNAMMGEFQ